MHFILFRKGGFTMAVNGIYSYGMNFFNYQSSFNNFRLTQALSTNAKFQSSGLTPSVFNNGSMKSSLSFIKDYSSSMSNLMSAANSLRTSNKSGVMNQLAVSSSDKSVAVASEKFPPRSTKKIQLDVAQVATAQKNTSFGVKSGEAAKSDMNFNIGNSLNAVNVRVSATNANGTAKTNLQMLKDAAEQINRNSKNVTASVIQNKDGTSALSLTGKFTGALSSFSVKGTLGAAEGLDKVEEEAVNAKYSVTTDGKTETYESSSNDISLDFTRIGVELKGTGTTTISAGIDSEKLASSVENLVKSYNSTLKLLNDNYSRGNGVERQLRNFVRGIGTEEAMEKLGITVKKDATLSFDKEVFAENLKKDPKFTMDLISGTNGIANQAFSKAQSAVNSSAGSLINGDLSTAQSEEITNPYNVFSLYSKSGVYNMTNYYATGYMLNYLV